VLEFERCGERLRRLPLLRPILARLPQYAGFRLSQGSRQVLQKAGFIRYSRGRIAITDRAGLEGASRECYAIVRAHFDRLLA